MTIHQAKADAKARLTKHGCTFSRLSAETVSFEGFGYGEVIFLTVHGMNSTTVPHREVHQTVFGDVAKPSEGGYIAKCQTVAP